MKQAAVSIVLALSTCCSSVALFAGPADADAKKAADAKPKSVIRCSPEEKDGALLPSHAMAKLAKGDSIVFLPGCYDEVVINVDSVIVSTEGDKPVDVSVVLRGKNCIVRDFCGRRINATNDASIVNSCFETLHLDSTSDKKADLTVYNCAFMHLYNSSCYDKEWDINMANCVVRSRDLPEVPERVQAACSSQEGCVTVAQRTLLDMQNCVISSNSYALVLRIYERSIKAKITLKDNIFSAKKGLGIVRAYSGEKNDKMVILEPKEIKKVVSTSLQGENKLDKVEFLGDNPESPSFFMISKPELKGVGIIKEQNPFFKDAPVQAELAKPEGASDPAEKENVTPPPRRPPERRCEPERKPPEEHPEEEDVFKAE